MKLFEKKRDGCRRVCYFCGKEVFSYRRKNSNSDVKKTDFEIFDYCKNYKYVLDQFLEERREKREERREKREERREKRELLPIMFGSIGGKAKKMLPIS